MFIGIDLTASARRPSSCAVLSPSGELVDLVRAGTDAEIVALVRRHRRPAVAVDAPIGLPAGMCCLEPACPCRATAADGLRASERECIRRGIPLFVTNKRSIIKAMVYRAIGLRRVLEARGVRVLEVYPYGAKVRLFGRRLPKKHTPEGLAFIRTRLAGLVRGLPGPDSPLSHDDLDAILAAYVARLAGTGDVEELGGPEEGRIYLPKVSGAG